MFQNQIPSLKTVSDAAGYSDYRVVWYAVAAIVLFVLAAAAIVAAVIYCDYKGMTFGAMMQANWTTYYVGCFPK